MERVLRRGLEFTLGGVSVRLARETDLDALADMFDAYRVFYRQASDRARARRFIEERMTLHESVILVAGSASSALEGFAQLYPSFTSAGTARTWILNDLYVRPESRRRGMGRALVAAAVEVGRSSGSASVALATERINVTAQPLYEAFGFQRDTTFYHYRLRLE